MAGHFTDKVRKFFGLKLVGNFVAEYLGTFIFVTIATGSVTQIILSHHELREQRTDIDMIFFVVNVAEGVGLAIGMYVAIGVSGGYLNPAVSFASFLLGNLDWKVLIVQWLGQYLGAFFGCYAVFLLYHDAQYILHPNPADNEVLGSIFASHPQQFLGFANSIFAVTANSALFTILFLALTDKLNTGPKRSNAPFFVGLVLTGIGLSLGLNFGTAINPAKDLSSRLFSRAVGWNFFLVENVSVFWFWKPALLPFVGAIIGVIIYQLFIGNHWPHARKIETDQGNFSDDPTDGEIILVRHSEVQQKTTARTSDVLVFS